eukprot:scaffold13782_cov78-Cyclotella_meneghiniana.AAC.5
MISYHQKTGYYHKISGLRSTGSSVSSNSRSVHCCVLFCGRVSGFGELGQPGRPGRVGRTTESVLWLCFCCWRDLVDRETTNLCVQTTRLHEVSKHEEY